MRAVTSGGALGDMRVDHPLEQSERDVAAEHQRIVERAEVETRAERLLGLFAQTDDLAVADLVAAGLAGPGAIAVDLALHLLDRRAVGCREPLDRMRPGPALRMKPGVDDEPAGAEGERLE